MRVIVLGAGAAGCSAAIGLASAGADVLLVDPAPPGAWRPGEGLPAAARPLLRRLGVWEEFREAGHLPCHEFRSSWADDAVTSRSTVTDPRGPSWQLDRPAFDAMLLRRAERMGVDRLPETRFTGVRRHAGGWLVELSEAGSARRIATPFVVDATGRNGRFARRLSVPRVTDHRLVSIAAVLADPAPETSATTIESCPLGWWYSSRIPGGRVVVALFTDPGTAGALELAEPREWLRHLRSTTLTGERLSASVGGVAPSLRVSTASSSHLQTTAGDGWAAVGDAAIAHDPLAARGLHDALETGLAAVDVWTGGRTASAYAASADASYRRYLAGLRWYYDQEKRFLDAPFWRSIRPTLQLEGIAS
jgi:flavin-dependent dehydrogenase